MLPMRGDNKGADCRLSSTIGQLKQNIQLPGAILKWQRSEALFIESAVEVKQPPLAHTTVHFGLRCCFSAPPTHSIPGKEQLVLPRMPFHFGASRLQ